MKTYLSGLYLIESTGLMFELQKIHNGYMIYTDGQPDCFSTDKAIWTMMIGAEYLGDV